MRMYLKVYEVFSESQLGSVLFGHSCSTCQVWDGMKVIG